jgi:hypothetical protein
VPPGDPSATLAARRRKAAQVAALAAQQARKTPRGERMPPPSAQPHVPAKTFAACFAVAE